jgi:hypothetical protein
LQPRARSFVTVTKVDPKARTVTFRGPKGNTLVYTEALAVNMVAQAPAKKAPAKNEK